MYLSFYKEIGDVEKQHILSLHCMFIYLFDKNLKNVMIAFDYVELLRDLFMEL